MNSSARIPLPVKFLIAGSMGCYFASLFFECYRNRSEEISGHTLFLVGFLGLLAGEFVWLANPFWFCAWPSITRIGQSKNMSSKFGLAETLSSIGLIIALLFLFQRNISTAPIGSTTKILAYGPGYYLWLSSFVLQLASAVLMRRYAQSAVSNSNELTSTDGSESATKLTASQ